jgi:hypothetical protein
MIFILFNYAVACERDSQVLLPVLGSSGSGVGGARTGLIWLRIGTGGRYCKCGNEPSGSIKCGEFLDFLRTG